MGIAFIPRGNEKPPRVNESCKNRATVDDTSNVPRKRCANEGSDRHENKATDGEKLVQHGGSTCLDAKNFLNGKPLLSSSLGMHNLHIAKNIPNERSDQF